MKNPSFARDSASRKPGSKAMPLSIVRIALFALLALGIAFGARAEEQRVDVNTADAETIAQVLVGVGQSKAEAIVAYREENGRFEHLEDLAKVRGIGEATVRRNEDRISLGDEDD